MRRTLLLGTFLLLSGCSGLGHFFADTETLPGANPNGTTGISENLARARGRSPEAPIVEPQQGNIWPGPPKPLPTLADVAKNGGLGDSSNPLGGAMPNGGSMSMGEKQSIRNGVPVENPSGGFSGGGGSLPATETDPAARFRHDHPLGAGPAPSQKGVDVKGTDGPVGGDIVIPNGDGTSTVISPDGAVKTVKGTPK
ncbi:MAG: hypothetical protein INR65_13805 [Gluconacetobacter diazotrophicus]|nr:hypothetical protein [Gluconacetobacter diazotrophicus]